MSVWCSRTLVYAPFHYGLVLSEDAFRRELRKMKIDKSKWPEYVLNWHSTATCHWFEDQKNLSLCAIITLRDWEDKEDTAIYGLLVHEAMHLWQEAKIKLGDESPSPEFEAYAVQNLAQNLFEQFKKQREAQ